MGPQAFEVLEDFKVSSAQGLEMGALRSQGNTEINEIQRDRGVCEARGCIRGRSFTFNKLCAWVRQSVSFVLLAATSCGFCGTSCDLEVPVLIKLWIEALQVHNFGDRGRPLAVL